MKDIDFDELDKAVNSLMGGVKVASERPEAKTLTLPSTLKVGEQPEYDKIQRAAEKIGSETLLDPTEKTAVLPGTLDEGVKVLSLSDAPLQPMTVKEVIEAPVLETTGSNSAAPVQDEKQEPDAKPSLAAKAPSSGRFMDVMHPSSDMKVAAQEPAKPNVHTGRAIAPVAPAAPEVTPQPKDTQNELEGATVASAPFEQAEQSAPEPEIDETTSLVEDDASVVSPDAPVDTVKTHNVTNSTDAVSETVQSTPVDGNIETNTAVDNVASEVPSAPAQDSTETIEPLTSPFLPDAKVEKRPLGGTIDTSAEDLDIQSLDSPYRTDNSADTQLTPTNAEQPALPDELHTDLLAIETNLADETKADQNNIDIPSSDTTTTPALSQTVVLEDKSPAQQESIDTPENGAIFDTTDYHKPIAHPAKHTSEWVWIALIVGIIVVCAVGAGAFYLLSTQ
jgi:hypothetical protein